MDSITKLLPNLIRLSQNNEEMCQGASFVAWRIVVGEAITRISTPQRLVRKTMVIAVIDEIWRKQLMEISSPILFKLNKLLGTAMVTSLEFFVDPLAVTSAEPPIPTPTPDTFTIDSQLLDSAAQIKDDKLRTSFLKAASKYLQIQTQNQTQE